MFTAFFARVFFSESLGPRGGFGVLLVLGAATMLAVPTDGARVDLLAPGVLLVAGACIAWSLDNNLVATVDGFTPAQSTAVKGAIAGSANLVLGLAFEGVPSSMLAVVGALAVGALAYGASIVLYVATAQQLGATRSQEIFASAPFWGVALSWLVLGEPLGVVTLLAAVALVIAIALVQSDVHSHEHRHDRLVHTHWHRHDDEHHSQSHETPISPGTWHVHEHEHEPQVHDHAHRPDLHHPH